MLVSAFTLTQSYCKAAEDSAAVHLLSALNPGTQTLSALERQAETFMGGDACTAVDVASAQFYTLALMADGSRYSFGFNASGALGAGTSMLSTPARILERVVSIATGDTFSMAITEDGSLWGFGRNSSGAFGDAVSPGQSYPRPVRLRNRVQRVAVGVDHTLITDIDDTVWTFGGNEHGQLGDGTTADRSQPRRVMRDGRAVKAFRIFAGDHSSAFIDHTMDYYSFGLGPHGEGSAGYPGVIRPSGLWTFGYNGSGQLANGRIETAQPTPELVIAGQVDKVATGISHMVVILGGGALYAVGNNSFGQLGIGYNSYTPIPALQRVKIPGCDPVPWTRPRRAPAAGICNLAPGAASNLIPGAPEGMSSIYTVDTRRRSENQELHHESRHPSRIRRSDHQMCVWR